MNAIQTVQALVDALDYVYATSTDQQEKKTEALWAGRALLAQLQAGETARSITDEQILDEASHHGFLGHRGALIAFTRAVIQRASELAAAPAVAQMLTEDERLLELRRAVRTACMTGVPNFREQYDAELLAVLGVGSFPDLCAAPVENGLTLPEGANNA